MPTWKQIMHYIGHYIPTIEILLPIKKKLYRFYTGLTDNVIDS